MTHLVQNDAEAWKVRSSVRRCVGRQKSIRKSPLESAVALCMLVVVVVVVVASSARSSVRPSVRLSATRARSRSVGVSCDCSLVRLIRSSRSSSLMALPATVSVRGSIPPSALSHRDSGGHRMGIIH